MKYSNPQNQYDFDIAKFMTDFDMIRRKIRNKIKALTDKQKQAYLQLKQELMDVGAVENFAM